MVTYTLKKLHFFFLKYVPKKALVRINGLPQGGAPPVCKAQ